MNLAEYAKYDGLGLAELVAKKQVSPKELAATAAEGDRGGQPHRQRGGRDLSRPHRATSTRRRSAAARSAACRS